jgi:hypothetical protein
VLIDVEIVDPTCDPSLGFRPSAGGRVEMPEIYSVLTAISPDVATVITLYSRPELSISRFIESDACQSDRTSVEQAGIGIILQTDELFVLMPSWIGSEA